MEHSKKHKILKTTAYTIVAFAVIGGLMTVSFVIVHCILKKQGNEKLSKLFDPASTLNEYGLPHGFNMTTITLMALACIAVLFAIVLAIKSEIKSEIKESDIVKKEECVICRDRNILLCCDACRVYHCLDHKPGAVLWEDFLGASASPNIYKVLDCTQCLEYHWSGHEGCEMSA